MKKIHNISFAKQLTFYLLSALFITFTLIAVALTNSLDQFIHNNAYEQSKIFTSNILYVFNKQMGQMENMLNSIEGLTENINDKNAIKLPDRILHSYTLPTSCTIHYDPRHPSLGHIGKIFATRNCLTPDDSVRLASSDLFYQDTNCIVKNSQADCYWAMSTPAILSLYANLHNNSGQPIGMLKIDFPLKTITDFLCDYSLYHSGYLFVVDQHDNYVTCPDSLKSKYKYFKYLLHDCSDQQGIIGKFDNNKTGYAYFNNGGIKNYLYLATVPQTRWRLGIICPYDQMISSSRKLYILLIACLGVGSLFLFIYTINIVHHLTNPLKQLAYTARQMAKGRFDIKLSTEHSSSEIQELYLSFRHMQQSIINYIERLTITTAEKEQFNSEMRLAQKIQQSFLPSKIDLPDKVELYAELHQSKEVGGDLYEYFLKDDRLYFAIGDVAGKGTPAALYMASITKFFRYVASDKHSTADICNVVNQHSCANNNDDIYITMFVGIIDITTGTLTFTNAGHPYPLIVNASNEISLLNMYPDVPIGVLEDYQYTEHVYTLQEDSTIVLYTDGITDSENKKSEFFGKENLIKSIQSVSSKRPEEIIKMILKDIQQHIEGCNQSDDLTVLSIRYKKISGKIE